MKAKQSPKIAKKKTSKKKTENIISDNDLKLEIFLFLREYREFLGLMKELVSVFKKITPVLMKQMKNQKF